MTRVLEPFRSVSAEDGETLGAATGLGADTTELKTGWFVRHPAWPITAVLAGIPVWWALGIGDYIFVFLAVPMLGRMYSWSQHGRRLRVPPGFGLWLLFLIVSIAGIATIGLTAPGTVASPVSNRIIAYLVRLAQYLGVTVMLLYAGNLTEKELPRRRIAWLLGLVVLYSTVGGVGGMVAPHFQLTSPLAYLIPRSMANSGIFLSITHPALAEVQSLLGAPSGRPDAPFKYTNIWGSAVVMLVPWLLVGWWWQGTRRQRRIVVAVLVILVVPFLYSLNRGAWIGAILAIFYLAVRLAAQGKFAMLGALSATLLVFSLAIAVTPLQTVITGRIQNGKSDGIRGMQAYMAVVDAASSPIIGYGDSRHLIGSPGSIAVGPTANCRACGEASIAGNGQLWMLLICSGFLGAVLYIAFFAYGAWCFRRDRTPYGLAGVLVILLSLVFMFTYVAVGLPLVFIMLSYALLWRNSNSHQQDMAARIDANELLPISQLVGERPLPLGGRS